jgi:hypothetical protein
MNKEQRLAWQREYRKNNGNISTKKYEKTKKGFLVRLYRNMQSRVTGVQKLKAHLYVGKSLLDRDEFYDWSIGNPKFHALFSEWESSNYERKLAPSVDRIDSSKGYTISNMEWVTFTENCKRGVASKNRMRSTTTNG